VFGCTEHAGEEAERLFEADANLRRGESSIAGTSVWRGLRGGQGGRGTRTVICANHLKCVYGKRGEEGLKHTVRWWLGGGRWNATELNLKGNYWMINDALAAPTTRFS
jgi:hypothetical protein